MTIIDCLDNCKKFDFCCSPPTNWRAAGEYAWEEVTGFIVQEDNIEDKYEKIVNLLLKLKFDSAGDGIFIYRDGTNKITVECRLTERRQYGCKQGNFKYTIEKEK